MPSQKQKAWYWREWGRVVKCCQDHGRKLTNDDRHALTKRTLGREKSMLDLDNQEFDQVIGAFMAINTPDDLNPQLRQIQQPRTRMLHLVTNELPAQLAAVLQHPEGRCAGEKLSAAEHYILAILDQKYKAQACQDLKDEQLHLLIIDINRAINRRRHGLHITCADVRHLADSLLQDLIHQAHAA